MSRERSHCRIYRVRLLLSRAVGKRQRFRCVYSNFERVKAWRRAASAFMIIDNLDCQKGPMRACFMAGRRSLVLWKFAAWPPGFGARAF